MTRRAKRWWAAVVGGLLAVSLVVGAIVSTGNPAIETDLDPANVWVANGSLGLVGTVNTQVGVLESIVEPGGSADEVLQSDAGVVIVDRASSTLRLLDARTGESGPAVPIEASADVQLQGSTLSILSAQTGELWLASIRDLEQGRGLEEPIVELGRGAAAALTESTLFVASPGLGRVLSIDVATGDTVDAVDAPMSATQPELQLTAVGDRWVLLDETAGVLSSGAWQTRLDAAEVALQEPGPESDAVVLATDEGVLRYRIGLDASENLVTGFQASPTRPLLVDGCVLAAWSSGDVWRQCAEEQRLSLTGVAEEPSLDFATRGTAVVLTDAAAGDSWNVSSDGALVDDWSMPDQPPSEGPIEDGDESVPNPEDLPQEPPVAEDDELGARAGRVTMLPVLLNDSDPNGDALTILEVEGEHATISSDGRAIRLELPADATGEVSLEYTVTDGHGGSDTASVRVTIRDADENGAPVQMQAQTMQLGDGGTAVANALEHWVDPDGDPLVLVDASIDASDAISFRADGRLVVTDGGAGTVRDLDLVVSDGFTTSRGSLTLTPIESPTLTADPITITTYVGQTTVIEPMLSVRGGAGDVRLHNVPPVEGVSPNYRDDTIAVTPTEPGTMTFTYVATDGTDTAQGEVRVLVLDEVDASTPPLTQPHAVAVLPGGTVEVPVADLDVDPAGGVLLVTDLDAEVDDAVRLDLIDQETVRVELVGPLDGPVVAEYTVSNGVSEAVGTITIVERGDAATLQAPIARDDEVRVRPGGAIDIRVLGNDEHPDGASIELSDELVEDVDDGLLFVDGDVLRFVAPSRAGTETATYEIVGPDGQTSTAEVTIVIAEADSATNADPTPPTVDARVVAGETVDITIDLTAADPNGDAVVLIGQSSPATLGTLTQVDQTFQYTAGPYSVGTDVIEYVVADELGARATGTIRVGVAGLDAVSEPPVAVPDEVSVLPGTTLAVDVLANDADPAGLPLEVASVEPQGEVEAEVEDGSVVLSAPDEPGEHGVVVTIQNSRGSTAVGWLRVVVDPEAEPPPPDAGDYRVPLEAILDDDVVRVEPLETTTIADGATEQLSVSLPVSQSGVELHGDALVVDVQDASRIVPYTVTRDDTGASSTALVFVPGLADSLPQLRADVEPIVVASGETVDIDINDYIIAVGGDVMITDASQVRASHNDDGQTVVDADTVRFTSAPGYFGPADISFEVTDGDSPTDPDGRTAPIVLPIQVEATGAVPGRVLGATIQLEPGQSRTLDLVRITTSPDPSAVDDYTWSLESAVPEGFTAEVSGAELVVTAESTAATGSAGALTVGVADDDGEGVAGDVTLSVISSTRPLAQPQPDAVAVTRGSSETVDLLANDEATNPFPDTPLEVGAVTWTALPTGVTVQHAEGSSDVTVTASEQSPVGSITVRYQVLDATGDERRATWGTLTITVQDVPDRPSPPVQVTDRYVDGALIVRITPPADNNSPITGYVIVGPGDYRHDCGRQTVCTLGDLEAGVDVQLQVIAVNGIGESDPSALSEPMHADRLPSPVTGIQASPTTQAGVSRISWNAVSQPQGGTPVESYLVHVTGPGVDTTIEVDAGETSTLVSGLQPGAAYRADVAATNGAGVDASAWRWSTAPRDFTAVGKPGTTSITYSGNPQDGSVDASWTRVAANGTSTVAYTVSTIADGTQPPGCTSGGGGDPAGQTTGTSRNVPIPQGETVRIVVVADNGWFCSTSVSDPVVGKPDEVQPGDVTMELSTGTAGSPRNAADIRITSADVPQGYTMQVRIAGSSTWRDWSPGMFLAGSGSGVAYGESNSVEARMCVRQAGITTCSDTSVIGSLTPVRVEATASGGCTPGERMQLQVLGNTSAQGSTTRVRVRFLDDAGQQIGSDQTVRGPALSITVPDDAASVQLWGEVAGASDPVPTTVTCEE